MMPPGEAPWSRDRVVGEVEERAKRLMTPYVQLTGPRRCGSDPVVDRHLVASNRHLT
jgi:hypothetical protein